MRKLIACLCTATLTLGLVACGGSQGASKSASRIEVSAAAGETASIDFKGWKLDFGTPKVVWSEYQESDLLVIPLTATNNTGKAAKFEDIDNINAIPKGESDLLSFCEEDELTLRRNAIDEAAAAAAAASSATGDATTTAASTASAATSADATTAAADQLLAGSATTDGQADPSGDGTVYTDISAAEETTENGQSIQLTYSWLLKATYGTIDVSVQGYSASSDDTTIAYNEVYPTEQFTQYQTLAEIQANARRTTNEARIKGATFYTPTAWYIDNIKQSSVDVHQTADGKNMVRVQFITTAEPAADRARKYAANYKLAESEVQSAVIAGVEWFYFKPTDTQFQAYTQSTDGIVNVYSTVVSWEDAQPVLESVAIH